MTTAAAAAAATAAAGTGEVAAAVTMTAALTATVMAAAVAATTAAAVVTAVAVATARTVAVARTRLWHLPEAPAYLGTAAATVAVESSFPPEAVPPQTISSGVPKKSRGSMTYAQTSAEFCNNFRSGCFHHSGRNKPPPWAPTLRSTLCGKTRLREREEPRKRRSPVERPVWRVHVRLVPDGCRHVDHVAGVLTRLSLEELTSAASSRR